MSTNGNPLNQIILNNQEVLLVPLCECVSTPWSVLVDPLNPVNPKNPINLINPTNPIMIINYANTPSHPYLRILVC